jgi:hypothetical protein
MNDRRDIIWASTFASVIAVIASAIPFRGLNLWALWQVEAVERFALWQESGDEGRMGAAFDNSAGILPSIPRLVGWLFDDALLGVRSMSAVAVAVIVFCVARLVTRSAGRRAAMLAVGALVLLPRFWAMATVPSATVFSCAALLAMWTSGLAARDDWRWAPIFLALLTFGLGVHPLVWILLIPFAWVVLVRPETIRRGVVEIRPVGLWMLAIPVLALMLFVVVNPYFHEETIERLATTLNVWLERPAEPFLYAGNRMGSGRMLPHVPLHLLALTTPPALVAGACGGLLAIRGLSAEARHDLWALGIFLLGLPFLMRSVYFAGADLLGVGAIFVAILAGVGLDLAMASVGARFGRAAALVLVGAVGALSAVDIADSGTHFESYYSGLIGGTDGAALRGYSRYPHPPVPVPELRALSDSGVRRLAILTNGWELRPVINRYRDLGLVAPDFELVQLARAQAIVVHVDDTLPELYSIVRDAGLFLASSPDSALFVGSGSAPLFVFGRIAP